VGDYVHLNPARAKLAGGGGSDEEGRLTLPSFLAIVR
jgi:hypothetical protein